MKIDEDVLRQAAEAMLSDLGETTDLPAELANTIANVYYRFFACAEHMMRGGNTNLLEPYLESPTGFSDAFRQFSQLNTDAIAAIESVKDLVRSAREAKEQGGKVAFSYCVTLILDVFKYGISNAHTKSPIRRAIERKFKKTKEIPDLFHYIRSHSFNKTPKNSQDEFFRLIEERLYFLLRATPVNCYRKFILVSLAFTHQSINLIQDKIDGLNLKLANENIIHSLSLKNGVSKIDLLDAFEKFKKEHAKYRLSMLTKDEIKLMSLAAKMVTDVNSGVVILTHFQTNRWAHENESYSTIQEQAQNLYDSDPKLFCACLCSPYLDLGDYSSLFEDQCSNFPSWPGKFQDLEDWLMDKEYSKDSDGWLRNL